MNIIYSGNIGAPVARIYNSWVLTLCRASDGPRHHLFHTLLSDRQCNSGGNVYRSYSSQELRSRRFQVGPPDGTHLSSFNEPKRTCVLTRISRLLLKIGTQKNGRLLGQPTAKRAAIVSMTNRWIKRQPNECRKLIAAVARLQLPQNKRQWLL